MLQFLITGGDPGGIGSESIIKTLHSLVTVKKSNPYLHTFRESLRKGTCSVTVFTSKMILQFLIKKYALPLEIFQNFIFHKHDPEIRFFLPDIGLNSMFVEPPFGIICKKSGEYSWQCIQESIQWGKKYMHEQKDFCIFNLPVCKRSIEMSQKSFLGHTEEYANAFGIHSYAMTFLSPICSLILMTTHVPVSKVASMITSATIQNAFSHAIFVQKITNDPLPILVLGLNPHAGEGGMLGMEEKLIDEIRQKMIPHAVGPISPDVAFLKVLDGSHKTVIACYHDQGLIPMKLLSRFESCNYTAGLPFVRTSVDHGPAFDIAGTMRCNVASTLYSLAKTYQLSLDFSRVFSSS